MRTPFGLSSPAQWQFPKGNAEAEGPLSWGRRLQAENFQLREKFARLEEPLGNSEAELLEAFREEESRRLVFSSLPGAVSGVPVAPKLAPTALATRRARLLLQERYPDAAKVSKEAVSSPLAATRIAAESSRGRNRPAELTNPRRAAEKAALRMGRSAALPHDKALLTQLLETRTELEELRQLEGALKAENRELSEAVLDVTSKADGRRREAQEFRDYRRTPSPEAPPELKAVRAHVQQRQQEVRNMRKMIERAEAMNSALDGLKKALKTVLPERVLGMILARWYDVCYRRNELVYLSDLEAQGIPAPADVLEESDFTSPETSRSPERRTQAQEQPSRSVSPGAKRRAEKRNRRGRDQGFNSASPSPRAADAEGTWDILGGFGAANLFGGGGDSAEADGTEPVQTWAALFGLEEEDDGTGGEWFSVWGEEDNEESEKQRKNEYEEVDKQRAKDQLAPLFAGRQQNAAGGAKDRKEARKKAAARKKAEGRPAGAAAAAALASEGA